MNRKRLVAITVILAGAGILLVTGMSRIESGGGTARLLAPLPSFQPPTPVERARPPVPNASPLHLAVAVVRGVSSVGGLATMVIGRFATGAPP